MEQEVSPYEPPKSDVGERIEENKAFVPAGKWRRFFNLLIDYIGFTILGALVGFMTAMIWGHAGVQFINSLPDFVVGAPIVLTYYIVLEALFGRTLGKLITGTKVVGEDGNSASFGQIIGRSLSRLIPFEAFSFLGATGRGWHDSLAKTYVVRTNPS